MAGRPKAQPQLTPEQVQELAALGCTDSEIATLAAIGEATLKRNFEPHLRAGRAQLRESLRRAQVKRAIAGSDAMLIWLGKQYLDQRDKQDIDATLDATVERKGYTVKDASPDAWDNPPADQG